MPYRRTKYRRRRRTTVRRRPRKKRYVKKKPSTRTMMRIPRPIVPLRRAYCNHRKIMYFRIPGAGVTPGDFGETFTMGGFGNSAYRDGLGPYPHLMISTNDPMAPVNQMRTPADFPGQGAAFTGGYNTPAFFSTFAVPGQTLGLWDSTGQDTAELGPDTPKVSQNYKNRYPSRWLKMCQFFNRYTVVGSKCHLQFQPNPITAQTRVPDPVTGETSYISNLANPAVFCFGKRQGRNPRIEDYPQALEENPDYTSKQWFGISTDRAKYNAISFTGKWSARKDMQLAKGDIVPNDTITGLSSANPCRCLLGTDQYVGPSINTNPVGTGDTVLADPSQHPRRQHYFHFLACSGLNGRGGPGSAAVFEPSKWPAGIIKITMDYSTVWTNHRQFDNEDTVPALPWQTPID